MNALLSHVWGKGKADRVWGHVVGLAPRTAVRRFLMVFKAFIDDSSTPGGEFVLAGHVANAEEWAEFTKEWEELLLHGLQESPHFENGVISRLFGPHVGRKEGPKVPY